MTPLFPIFHFLALSLLWLMFTEGRGDAWIIGIPTLLLAAGLYQKTAPTTHLYWRMHSLPEFIFYFLRASLQGGIDVARRALSPHMPLQPGFINYRLRLPPGPARMFLINTISLLPGTLSAKIENDQLCLHALSLKSPVAEETAQLEAKVARLFNLRLEQ